MTEGNPETPESTDVKVESGATNEAAADAIQETTVDEEASEVRADFQEQLQLLEDKLAQTETQVAELEKKAAEYLDGWQRAQASFANFRKRTEAEQSQWRSAANAQILARLLPVLDDFKRAFEAVPESYEKDAWLEGIRLIERKLRAILDMENVRPIQLQSGDPFDPKYHDAVLYQEVEGFEEGQIVAEIETGYMLGDRVLRPSVVVVAKGVARPEPTPEPADEDVAAEPATAAESAEDASQPGDIQDA